MRRGKSCTVADETDVRKYLPMILWHLKRYHPPAEHEDMKQEAFLAALEELANEGPEQDLRVRRAISRRLRQLSRSRKNIGAHEAHLVDEEGNPLVDETVGEEDNCQFVIGDCWVEWMLGRLRGRQKECASLYFCEGLTQVEISKRLGMRQQYVSQAILGAIKNLRKLCQ